MTQWKRILSLTAICGLLIGMVAFAGLLPSAADTTDRNLLLNADGSSDPGKYGSWLTKYVYSAQAAPTGETLDLTGAAYAAQERDWTNEKPGKAVDGNTAAGTGDTFFMTLPDATDAQARLGLLIDLQEEYTLHKLSYFNNKYIAGGHRRYRGAVYAGNALSGLQKAATFDTYNNGDALQVDISLDTTARYLFVAFNERNAFYTMERNGGTFTGIAVDEVQVWGGAAQRTVTFDYAGAETGAQETTRTVENGTAVGALPTPGKSGEAFIGWFDGDGSLWDADTPVTGDVTLTARFGKSVFPNSVETITWFTKVHGNAAALPQVTKTTFDADEKVIKAIDGNINPPGGFVGGDTFKLKLVEGSDSVGFLVDLQAQYDLTLFRLTMTTQDGWMVGNRAAKGSVYTSENGTDWDNGTAFDNAAQNIEIPVLLQGKRARYLLVMITNPGIIQYEGAVRIYETELFGSPAACTVRFEDCTLTDKTVSPGDRLDLSAETPTKDGAWFKGYYTDAACTEPFINGSVITEDTTLYADWISVKQEPQVQAVQVRLVGDEGLRFISQIDETAVAQLEALDSAAEIGTVVAPKAQVTGAFDLSSVDNTLIKKAPADNRLQAGRDYTEDGTVKFTAVVIQIPQKNFASDVAARTYVTYTDASGIKREYYSSEGETAYYAVSLKKAAEVTLGQYGDTLTETEKARLDAIMAAQ